ncbi:MAG: CAP domain-containing protein, partial [Eubacterium sp.]|nr:CAP domain-containing protein [Eubacterium sp.]
MMKRILSILIITVLVMAAMIVTASAAEAKTGYVYVNAKQDYAQVQDALTALNKQRKKAGLNTVKLDKELCDLAVQRAAESVVYIDDRHTRPNGSACGTISARSNKENWAMGTFITGTSVIDSVWLTSAGHKKNMLYDKAKSVGIGFITSEDFTPYCILILSSTDVKKEMTTATGTKKYYCKVAVKDEYLKKSNFSLKGYSIDGTYVEFPAFDSLHYDARRQVFVEFDPGEGKSRDSHLAQKSFIWTSSNKLIANMTSEGSVYGVTPGTCEISATMKDSPGFTITTPVTVYEKYYGYDDYDYDSDPYYPEYFEEDDDQGGYWLRAAGAGSEDQSKEVKASSAAAEAVEILWRDPASGNYVSGDEHALEITSGDTIAYRVSESEAENEELLKHITINVDLRWGFPNSYTVDTENHTVKFNQFGDYVITATGDDQVTVTGGELFVYVHNPLTSVGLELSPEGSADILSEVSIEAYPVGGKGGGDYAFTIKDSSGTVIAESTEKEWTWTPDKLGTYTILVSYTEDGKTLTSEESYQVVKIAHPQFVPAEEYTVTGGPGNVHLPPGWEFSASDRAVAMSVGETRSFTAHYTAADKDLYQNIDASVRVKCVSCEHPASEVRNAVPATCCSEGYSGETYCTSCGMVLKDCEILPIDPNNHTDVITTQRPAQIRLAGHTEHQYCTACNSVVKQGEEIPAIDSYVMNTPICAYTGEAVKVNGVFKAGNKVLVEGQDYTAEYKDNVEEGPATVTYTFQGDYTGTFDDYFAIEKGSSIIPDEPDEPDGRLVNPLTAKGKTVTVKYAKLKKKQQTIKAAKAFAVTDAKGAVTYQKTKGNAKITVGAKGKITVKKGLKKG